MKSKRLLVVVLITLLLRLNLLHADPGSLDLSFDCGTNLGGPSFGSGPHGTLSIAVQPDGKAIVNGAFQVNNVAGLPLVVARFDANGTLDKSFNVSPYLLNYYLAYTYPLVNSILIQPDGMIIIGGNFVVNDPMAGPAALSLTRLTATGNIDTNFPIVGVDGTVNALALQTNGGILIGGLIDAFIVGYGAFVVPTNETPVTNLFRIDSHGNLDTNFNPALAINFSVNSIVLQNDQKIIVGGDLVISNRVASGEVIRFNPDGSLDGSFSPATTLGAVARSFVPTSTTASVTSLAIQPDGGVVVGGGFTNCNGVSTIGVMRLNPNGSLDSTFNSQLTTPALSMALQPDGRVIAAVITGTTNDHGIQRDYYGLTRLNTDGSLDPHFVSQNVNGRIVRAVTLQPDGRILFGGEFAQVNGTTLENLARLDGDPPLSYTTTPAYDMVSWPATYTNYLLQFKTNLSSPTWMDDPNPQTLVSNYFVVTNLIDNASKFYQLKK